MREEEEKAEEKAEEGDKYKRNRTQHLGIPKCLFHYQSAQCSLRSLHGAVTD